MSDFSGSGTTIVNSSVKLYIRYFYLQLLASFVIHTHGMIVVQNDWDIPALWGIPDYSDILTTIVEQSITNGTIHTGTQKVIRKVISTNLLNRKNKNQPLSLPLAIKNDIESIFNRFEEIDEIINLRNFVSKLVDINEVIDFDSKFQTVYCAAWDSYFQFQNIFPEVPIRDPSVRNNDIVNFDPELIVLPSNYDSKSRYLIDDRVIMCINGIYSDMIDICLRAMDLYRNGKPIESSPNPIVNSFHIQIVEMAMQKERETDMMPSASTCAR